MSGLIVDGNNLAQRAWRGMPELNTSKGQQVHVIFGVIKMIRTALREFKCDSCVVAWDGLAIAREQVYPDYKGRRKLKREAYTPEEQESYAQFKAQIASLQVALTHFGVSQLIEPHTEADDFIAVWCSSWADICTILSEDQDFIQLVSDKVTLHRPMTKLTYTPANFEELTRFKTTEQYLNYRVINGDDSDDIPGIPGFGGKEGKRASQLITEHGTLRNVLRQSNTLNKGKVMNTLFNSKQEIIRNFLLMDLTYSPEYLNQDLSECLVRGALDEPKVRTYLMQHEFFSLLSQFRDFISEFQKISPV